MAQVINTNIASLNAQRNLNNSQSSLQTSLERLSSGLRINSAKDDAAGLAISERFTTQIRGMDVAMRNANDGISLAQTAEGAMAEIGNNLQRIRELAVQSANATNSKEDREALNAEVEELKAEIDRVASQTDFNGTKLLDGSFSGALFQVGANAGQAISIDETVDAQTKSLGNVSFAADHVVTIDASADITDLKINGVEIGTIKYTADDQEANAAAVASAINQKVGETGVYAEVEDDRVTLVSVKADKALSISGTTATAAGFSVDADADTPLADADQALAVNGLDVSTNKGAQQAISVIDEALKDLNGARAEMGAVQNRFESVITNLSTTSENLQASRSRIQDADFAKETANLTRGQILQQAGTAMLAQANSLPQGVLSLLG